MRTRLQLWYDELRALPPQAEEWGEAGEFLALLKQLIESARDSVARQPLIHELETLRACCARELRFFGFEDSIREWSAAKCPTEQIQNIASRIARIRDTLAVGNLSVAPLESFHEIDQAARSARLLRDKILAEISFCEPFLMHTPALTDEYGPREDRPVEEAPAQEPCHKTEDLGPSKFEELFTKVRAEEPQSPTSIPQRSAPTDTRVAQPGEPLIEELGHSAQSDAPPVVEDAHEAASYHPQEPEAGKTTDTPPSVAEDDPNEGWSTLQVGSDLDEADDADYVPELEPVEILATTGSWSAFATRRAPAQFSEFIGCFTEQDESIKTQTRGSSNSRPAEALCLLSALSEAQHQEALWKLMDEADLTGAYWLALGLEEAAIEPAVPSWLLGLLQGSLWSSTDDPQLIDGLPVFIRDETLNEVQSVLAFAGALVLSLVAPTLANSARSPVKRWLVAPNGVSQLSPLAEMIDDFAQLNYPVQAIDVAAIIDDNNRDIRVDAAQKEAHEFLIDRRQRKRPTRMQRASDVYAVLVREGGDLSNLLQPVIDGRSDAFAEVRRTATFLSDPRRIRKLIDDIDLRLVKMKLKPIVSDPFEALQGLFKDAIHLALRWCNIIEGRKKEDAWIQAPLTKLRNGVVQQWSLFLASCSTITGDLSRRAMERCLRLALFRLGEILSVDNREPEPSVLPSPTWFVSGAGSIEIALSRRLLWYPETGGASRPTVDQTLTAALLLSTDVRRSVTDAVTRWFHAQDYRFIDPLITLIQDEDTRESLRVEGEQSRIIAESQLRDRKSQIVAKVQQALIDGVLDDREGRDSEEQLNAIVPEECFSFPSAYLELDEIASQCDTALTEKGRGIVERWRTSRRTAYENGVHLHTIARLDELMNGLLSRKNLRAAEQLLDSADVAAVRGSNDIEEQFSRLANIGDSSGRDVLAEFLEIEPLVYQWLVDFRYLAITDEQDKNYLPSKIRRGRGSLAGRLGPISDENRRREAAKGVETFLHLLRLGFEHHERRHEITTIVQDLLRFLGFVQVGVEGPAVVIQKSDPDWAVIAANSWSDGGTSPVPEYGSSCKGNYRIICLWNNFQIQRIEPLLESLGTANRPTILIYLAAASPDMRRRVRDITIRRKSSLLVLDATMLTFLAHENDLRLRSFFLSALPFSYAVPYIRERGGAVPREIFFGREDAIDRLWNPDGTCIIYGGRQLGKSALQNHIEERFHVPAREQYVFVIDMSAVYAPQKGNSIDNIWNELRRVFTDSNLVESDRLTSQRPDTIAGHIRNAINKVPDRRILIFLDESNDFLEAGQAEQFNTVNKLCDLMEATEWRFKVVFAGNRDVQRFSNIPNQRITRNGEPVVVGPLETPAAVELIRHPSEALGFRFEDQSAILRILSYTSGHANLIQFFLHELLVDRYTQMRTAEPPRYLITGKDVDALYGRQNVRSIMQDRIDMTLALDDDYRLVCFATALDQWPGDENLTRCYATAELLALARERWPEGFDQVTFSLMRVKLDEMCGLGLLVHDRHGRYRLISPSLMRLFGSVSDIEAQLREIARKPRPAAITEESLHAWVSGSKATRTTKYSPLTFAQESLLSRDRIGVRMLFASTAMGSLEIVESFQRLLPDMKSVGTSCDEAGDTIANYKAWQGYLETKWQEGSRLPTTSDVIYQKSTGTPAQLRECVAAALDYCARSNVQRNEKRSLRILFVFKPETAWNWMSNADSDRAQLEDRCQQILYPRKWDMAAIQRRLEETGHVVTPDICTNVLECTGGWPILLDRVLLHHSKRYEDLEVACDLLRQELNTPGDVYRDAFRRTLGIETCSPLSCLWTFFTKQTEPVYKILLEEESIDGMPSEHLDSALMLLKYFGLVEEKVDARDGQVYVPDPLVVSVWDSARVVTA